MTINVTKTIATKNIPINDKISSTLPFNTETTKYEIRSLTIATQFFLKYILK